MAFFLLTTATSQLHNAKYKLLTTKYLLPTEILKLHPDHLYSARASFVVMLTDISRNRIQFI